MNEEMNIDYIESKMGRKYKSFFSAFVTSCSLTPSSISLSTAGSYLHCLYIHGSFVGARNHTCDVCLCSCVCAYVCVFAGSVGFTREFVVP